jgi:hypothetical protein
MKMRTMRTAGLVGGLATGALLIAGTAAQAATDVAPVDSIGDLVMATPEALGGLPVSTDGLPVSTDGLPVSTDGVAGLVGDVTGQVPGLNAVPVESIPGVGALVPNGGSEEAKGDKAADPVKNKVDGAKNKNKDDDEAPAGDLVSDLLSGLGGGLPVPLPF